jgi:hypothetical protein
LSSDARPVVPNSGARSEVDAFLKAASAVAPAASSGRGRLIFALDATMSRQPTWDLAQTLQGRMFEATAAVGGLDVQLVYFRGQSECRASRFVSGGQGLAELMSRIQVHGGLTQIRKVLNHAVAEARRERVGALVFVGDAMEESVDRLSAAAGELALAGVKAFLFQEGDDPAVRRAFREIARITGGAYETFGPGAAARLAALLSAAASYAAGGRAALEALAAREPEAHRLLTQMRDG